MRSPPTVADWMEMQLPCVSSLQQAAMIPISPARVMPPLDGHRDLPGKGEESDAAGGSRSAGHPALP